MHFERLKLVEAAFVYEINKKINFLFLFIPAFLYTYMNNSVTFLILHEKTLRDMCVETFNIKKKTNNSVLSINFVLVQT